MPLVRWPIGYVRGALEHAAVAWLPAAAPSHVNLLERGLREAAASSPVSALNTVPRTNGGSPTFSDGGEKLDAGCQAAGEGAGSAIRGPPARDRRGLGTGAPAFGPRLEIARLPGLGESENPTVATDGWRHLPVGRVPDPGWGHGGGKGKRGFAAPRVPAPVCCPALDDGSVEGGVFRRWAGAVLVWLDEEVEELRAPAGELCYSYRAEMVALVTGPETVLGRDRDHDLRSVPIC